MRISWLAPNLISAARTALQGQAATWAEHFTPEFQPPPRPEGVTAVNWDHIAEHVARAERVTAVLLEEGFEEAVRRFAGSSFAIEVATLASAAFEIDQLTFEMVALVLACDIDDLVFYAPFLKLLVDLGGNDHDKVLGVYEAFSKEYVAMTSPEADWRERVAGVLDGLASAYVFAGRHDDGHALFERRHAEDTGDVAVALSASRSFLAAGAVARSIGWIGTAIERANHLGRTDLARILGEKQVALRKRLS